MKDLKVFSKSHVTKKYKHYSWKLILVFPVYREVLNDYDNADTISIDTLALEEMILEERAKEISQLNNLSKKVCNLHTSLLYYRNTKSRRGAMCYEAWRMLIKKIGGSPNTWREVGYALGIDRDDLDVIYFHIPL